MSFMEDAYARVKGRGARVVYAEGAEERAIRAAAWLVGQSLAKPALVGNADAIRDKAKASGVGLDGVVLRDPASDASRDAFVARYLELRAHKGVTKEVAA